jgi:hypothetical protein
VPCDYSRRPLPRLAAVRIRLRRQHEHAVLAERLRTAVWRGAAPTVGVDVGAVASSHCTAAPIAR